MSIRESLHWVALPAGAGTNAAGAAVSRVSVFIAPQVTLVGEPARTLRVEDLPDLVDWPATLAGLELAVEVAGGPAVTGTRVGPPPSSALWRRLFPGTTAVEPFVPDDPSVHPVVQYGVAEVLDVIETGYSDAAVLEVPLVDHFDPGFWTPEDWMPVVDGEPGPGEPGPGEPGGGPPEELVVVDGGGEGAVVGTVEEWSIRNLLPPLHEVVVEPDNSWLFGPGQGGANLLRHTLIADALDVAGPEHVRADQVLEVARFADALRFTLEPGAAAEVTDVLFAGEPAPLSREQRTAALVAGYDLHRLLAALGDHAALLRALGLVVDLEVPMPAPRGGRIRAVVRRPPTAPGAVEHTDSTPWVAVTGEGPTGFAAASVNDDVAPPGLETLEAYRVIQVDLEGVGIQLLERAAEEATGARNGRPAEPDLPPLRTAGLRLVQRGAAARLLGRAARGADRRLLVEDAEQEVLDADDVQRGFRLDVLDEASGHWHSLHARTARYDGTEGPLVGPVVDEGSVTGSFTGRPLAPGESLGPGDAIAVDEAVVTWDGWSLAAPRPGKVISADPLDADAAHRAQNGSAVAVRPPNDPLTSTGLMIETTALPGSLPRLRFGRSYRVRLRAVDLAGNALTVAEANAAVAAGAGTAVTPPVTFRRFERVPPPVLAFAPHAGAEPLRTGETEHRLVVRSGLDDGDDTFGPEPAVGERLVFPPACSVLLAEWHGVLDDGIGVDASAAARLAAYDRAARESGVLDAPRTELPWLADPASAGASFSGLPGMADDDVVTVPWPAGTHGPGPVRLRAVGVDTHELRAPEVDADAGVVTVFLPPGVRVTAAVSSVLADESVMALPALWRDRLDAAALDVVERRLARHRHAMVTPSVPVDLVHATQRPLFAPRPERTVELGERVAEQTTARVVAPWTVHAPTTGTLELHARWGVPRDEPVRLPDAGPGPDDVRWAGAETVVTAVAGRPLLVPAVPPAGPVMHTVVVGDVPEVGAAAGGVTLDLETTAQVTLRLRAVATSRFAEFFPPEYGPATAEDGTPVRPSRLTAASDAVEVEVPSTRRPPSPTVLEVMPVVVRHRDDGVVRREGGWLRVWLARPWFVTGRDELPAVVAALDGQPPGPEDPVFSLCTLVGPDPARELPAFTGVTPHALGGFPAAWATVRLLEVAHVDGARAIGLSDRGVGWDEARGAWYTDIRVDVPELYFPFVRLAIARDQPRSIRGTTAPDEIRVSPVVTLDPIQVLPDRVLRHSVTAQGVELELTGHSFELAYNPVNRGTAEAPVWEMEPLPDGAPSRARVVAQRRTRAGGDDMLAWEDVFEREMRQAPDAPAGSLVARLALPFDPTEPPGTFRLLVLEEDRAFGPRGLMDGEGVRARVTFAEVVPLSRAVTRPVG